MNSIVIGIIIGLILFGISAIACIFYCNRRETRLFSRLQRMLDDARDGTYQISQISEETISQFENSFKRYLDDSQLTREKQKEQKEMIQQLISDIAHQTLTPVSNLKLYTELLRESNEQFCQKMHERNYEKDHEKNQENSYGIFYKEALQDQEMIDTIFDETQKLDFLVQSLVKLSRMENGIISVHPKETSLTMLLDTVEKNYKNKAEQKNIALFVEKTSNAAVFDLKWTIEAVGNIVDNAIKYTPSGGAISITVQCYSFFVRIDITDNGIGIAEEEIPKIFSRFYRSFEVSDLPGVGIGLYLARFIVEQQKGYIKVKSQKGKGSVFSVFLPTAI